MPLLLTFAPIVFNRYFAAPTTSIADAVASFNARYADDPVAKLEPPLTEAEILAAIRVELPKLPASRQGKAILAEILRAKRLPAGASLHGDSGYQLANGNFYTVWWINLLVPIGKNFNDGLRIRENNTPVAKPKNEVQLQRSNQIWIQEAP